MSKLEPILQELYDIWDTVVFLNKTLQPKNPRLVTLQLDLDRVIEQIAFLIEVRHQ